MDFENEGKGSGANNAEGEAGQENDHADSTKADGSDNLPPIDKEATADRDAVIAAVRRLSKRVRNKRGA